MQKSALKVFLDLGKWTFILSIFGLAKEFHEQKHTRP